MATPDRAGWYDDPDNSEQLRYFDGILWTGNVTPRRTRWDAPVAQASAVGPDSPPSGQPTTPNPYAAPTPPASANPYAAPRVPAGGAARGIEPATKDGVPLASYWLRVAAYVIDSIATSILGMLLGGWFLWQAMAPVLPAFERALAAGDAEAVNAAIALVDTGQLGIYSAIGLLITLVYHLFFLTRWSATPGKLLLGISIRRTQHPGVLDFSSASRRVAFVVLLSALGNLPLIGFLALAARIADVLWPLTDRQRQALHDKVADTVVVVGKQERASASNTIR